MTMLKETKDPKHRPEALRQPQRKDSLTSVLSWAGLQTKPGSLRSTVHSATSSQQSQASPGTGLKSRRHSHGPDVKKKAREGSTISRKLSFSNTVGIQEGASAKTRQTKTLPTLDFKTTGGVVSSGTKTNKASSTEKLNKQAQDSQEGRTEKAQPKLQTRDRSTSTPERPNPPQFVPKSILRVSSPDGHRPPRRAVAYPASTQPTENGQQNSADQPALSLPQPASPCITEDPAPGSPPASPIARPLSPGATVRFAKATIHRVEVGPGRRFTPVKRKSKSTITYISPLDPVTQKCTPKAMLTNPTKLRRHVENQKAMGRYWMRTEEEEAQERAQAAMKAAEEAERYRAEPASPLSPSALTNSPAFQGFSWADGLDALDKLPPVDNLPSLDKLETDEVADKLETEMSDSEESEMEDSPCGAKIHPEEDQEGQRTPPIQTAGEKTSCTGAERQASSLQKPEAATPEPQKLVDYKATTTSSHPVPKTVAGDQEVKNTGVTAALQEAKTAISRPATPNHTPTSMPNLPSFHLSSNAIHTTAANKIKHLQAPLQRSVTYQQKDAMSLQKAGAAQPDANGVTTTENKSTTEARKPPAEFTSGGNVVTGGTSTPPPPPTVPAILVTPTLTTQHVTTTTTTTTTAAQKNQLTSRRTSPQRPPSRILSPTNHRPTTTATTTAQPAPTSPSPFSTPLSRPTSPTPGRYSSNHLHLSGRRGRRSIDETGNANLGIISASLNRKTEITA